MENIYQINIPNIYYRFFL